MKKLYVKRLHLKKPDSGYTPFEQSQFEQAPFEQRPLKGFWNAHHQSVRKSSARRIHVSGHPQKRNDQNKARKGRSFYNHPTFQRRAGLTARMVFPIFPFSSVIRMCTHAKLPNTKVA